MSDAWYMRCGSTDRKVVDLNLKPTNQMSKQHGWPGVNSAGPFLLALKAGAQIYDANT